MYQGWTAEMYRSTSKDRQIKVNEGYREEQIKIVERSQQKKQKKRIQIAKKIMSPLPQKKRWRT